MERKSLNLDDLTHERAGTPSDRTENEHSIAHDPDVADEDEVGDDENLPV